MESTPRRDDWHVNTADEAVAALGSHAETGLTAEEAARRLAEAGPNMLAAEDRRPVWKIFLGQFEDFMIWVLIVAAIISAFEGEVAESIAILAILVLNGVLGFAQEYRAEKALEALKEMSAPVATVIRDGAELDIPSLELVAGDVVLLEAGDKVPADCRLIEALALRVDESALTGESVPARKSASETAERDAVLGDRKAMVFASTAVAVGRARAIVTATGQHTEVGKIAELLASQPDEKTPLQIELKYVGKRIAIGVLAVAAVVFGVMVWRALGPGADVGSGLAAAALIAISLAVAAIPEGLPAVVTMALSIGVRRMAAHNAIVRRLHSVETLGATTFICSDKTGTITLNKMRVRRLVIGEDAAEVLPDFALEPVGNAPHAEDLELLVEAAAACNDARFDSTGALVGDPTETALLDAAHHLSTRHLRPRRVGEVPFDSERKRMTTVHETGEGRVAYMKGGADVVLGLCASALLRGDVVPMTDELRDRLQAVNADLASGGHRTLAVAYRPLSADEPSEGEELERDMVYIGITALLDPPRPEVTGALEECHAAGIHVAMITGDHALTARAIGAEIGLLEGKRVVTGVELEAMTDEDLEAAVDDIRIYARVNPEHKLRIVKALKARGHVVAMTGDGVNDAPALKRADIGVAMGKVGTDVSREAADMVLADDNFATIVEAIRQGRIIFDNLRKVVLFLLSCNMSEVLIVFITALISPEPALSALQLLWINLVTDGPPALALGVDPGSPRVMQRKPRGSEESMLTGRRQLQILVQGALMTLAGLIVYFGAEYGLFPVESRAHAHTMLFTAMVLVQGLHTFGFLSETRSVFGADSFRNKWLLGAFATTVALQACVIYLPALQRVFGTQALGIHDWIAVVGSVAVPFVLIDLVKVSKARMAAKKAAAL